MPSTSTAHVLDNPIWHALNTHQARFASGTRFAKRYPGDMFPAFAVPDFSDAALHDLVQIAVEGQLALVGAFERPPEIPGWNVTDMFTSYQMISQHPIAEVESTEAIVDLNVDDVPDMLHLVELAAPGPFLPRTVEMGHYIGIHRDGQLVAMAGERTHLTGYREISAVCAHPDYRGNGYASSLVSRLINENWQRGDTPILQVGTDNPARKVYERLDFRTRCEVKVILMGR